MSISLSGIRDEVARFRRDGLTTPQIATVLNVKNSQVLAAENLPCSREERHLMRQYPLDDLVAGVWYVIATKDDRGFWIPQPGPVGYDAAIAAVAVDLLFLFTRFKGKPYAPDRRIELVVRLTPKATRCGFGDVRIKALD